jgi:phosphate transport system substrate-binding protein
VPLYISPIAVAFNLPGVETLNMKPATIAGIFTQQITKWNARRSPRTTPTRSCRTWTSPR